jgi:hypothetical protein
VLPLWRPNEREQLVSHGQRADTLSKFPHGREPRCRGQTLESAAKGTVLGTPIVRDSVKGVVPKVEPHELCFTGDALRVTFYGLRFTGDALE